MSWKNDDELRLGATFVASYRSATPFPSTARTLYRCNECQGLFIQRQIRYIVGLMILPEGKDLDELEREAEATNQEIDRVYFSSRQCSCPRDLVDDDPP